jgi:hypothetical protein
MLTGLGKMVYLRGGMDKLPGHLQTIISWYAFSLVHIYKALSYL